MITERDIIDKTHYGLNIYAHILRQYYPDDIVIHLSGKQCELTKNPFNDDKVTLKLTNKDWLFVYEDIELSDFNGSPFDFAQLHYKLKGEELLKKLNEDLYLHIDEENNFYHVRSINDTNEDIEIKPIIHSPEFSYFKAPISNIYPERSITLTEVYGLIRSESFKDRTRELRTITSISEARKYKAARFDYVTFSGVFSRRSDKDLLTHSGLLTIDFDHIRDVQQLKEKLLMDEYFETELMFISPSGDGLKWIIPIDLTKAAHQDYFKAISAYVKDVYKLEIDKSGKDISRACFLPYDPEAYINPKYMT